MLSAFPNDTIKSYGQLPRVSNTQARRMTNAVGAVKWLTYDGFQSIHSDVSHDSVNAHIILTAMATLKITK